jgi:hypothetical protein
MLIGARSVNVVGVEASGARLVSIERAGHARDWFQIVENIATINGDVVQLLARDEVRTLARIGLQLDLAGVGSDFYLGSDGPDGENQVAGIHLFRRVQNNARGFEFFETRELDSDVVSPRRRLGALNSPVSDVVTLRVSPVAGSVTVTEAPLTAAPLGSCPQPKIVPEVIWARRIEPLLHRSITARMPHTICKLTSWKRRNINVSF